MISTLLNYRLYSSNISKSLDRVSQQAQVERDAAYYKDNIGKVKSVDDFLSNYRLYSYAMKAYGLEDQIASKGLMRKVLESDLTDASSFANKLTDKKYQQFAAAFNFSSSTELSAQSSIQTGNLVEAYTDRVTRNAPEVAKKTNYYSSKIGAVTTITEFVSDRGLLDVAMRAAGFTEPGQYSSSFAESILNGTTPTGDAKWVALKTQFTTSGTWVAQNPDAASKVVYDYNNATGNATSPQAKQANLDYFNSKIVGKDAGTLVSDDRLFSIVMTSMGFDIAYLSSSVTSYLKDPTTIPSSMSAVDKQRFATLRQALGVGASGAFDTAQQNLDVIRKGYESNYQNVFNKRNNTDTAVYQAKIKDVASVTELMAPASASDQTRRTLNYVLTAFDIDPSTASLSKIRAVLTSDPTDPNSYVSKLKDERYTKLAAAFNFDEKGKLRPERLVQSISSQTKTGTLYSESFGTEQSTAVKAQVKADTKTYLAAVGSATTINDILSNKKVVAYALKAYGVQNKDLTTDQLRKILTSDLGDPKSYANKQEDKAIAKLAAAFNFDTDGSVKVSTEEGVQTGASRLATDKLYLLQTLEEQAGETSEGTRLALYFLRKAPTVTTAYGILADKALLEVARTALGLPESMSSMDIEKQAKMLESKIDFKDFADAKKLDTFIGRFTALYDLNNSSTTTSPILQLFNASSSGNGLISLL